MMRMKWVGGDTPRGPRDVSGGGAKAGEFRPSLALAGWPQSYKAALLLDPIIPSGSHTFKTKTVKKNKILIPLLPNPSQKASKEKSGQG